MAINKELIGANFMEIIVHGRNLRQEFVRAKEEHKDCHEDGEPCNIEIHTARLEKQLTQLEDQLGLFYIELMQWIDAFHLDEE
jgi:hypothetical protein